MKKLHVENGLALLAALVFLASVSTATTIAMTQGYEVEMSTSAPTS